MELPDRCRVCGSLLERKSFYACQCVNCGITYTAQLNGSGGLCRIEYDMIYPRSAEEDAKYLAALQEQREKLQSESDSLTGKLLSWKRRRELKYLLAMLDRQINIRIKGEEG